MKWFSPSPTEIRRGGREWLSPPPHPPLLGKQKLLFLQKPPRAFEKRPHSGAPGIFSGPNMEGGAPYKVFGAS